MGCDIFIDDDSVLNPLQQWDCILHFGRILWEPKAKIGHQSIVYTCTIRVLAPVLRDLCFIGTSWFKNKISARREAIILEYETEAFIQKIIIFIADAVPLQAHRWCYFFLIFLA